MRMFISPRADPFLPRLLETHISLIPKPNKDHTLCSNFQVISLIGVDLKHYSKMIANRLQPLLPRSPVYVGFVFGQEVQDNTIKTLSPIQYVQTSKIPMCLLLVEKTFDRLS